MGTNNLHIRGCDCVNHRILHPVQGLRIARSYSTPRQAMLNVASVALFCKGSTVACETRIPAALSQHTCCVPSVSICKLHRGSCCPACDPQQYVTHRVVKAVVCGLKRLGLKKTQSILLYLGVNTRKEVRQTASVPVVSARSHVPDQQSCKH